jgi:phosphoglycerate dehydrogenase-like enzyme
MPETLIILDPISPRRLAALSEHLPERFTLEAGRSREPGDQLDAIRRARFVIAGQVPVTGEMMRAGAEAGLVAVHKWGVGTDNLDLEAARALGVRVLRTTGSNAVPVAELTLGFMLALSRGMVAGHMALSEGHWRSDALSGQMLSGRTIGIVGMGPIAQALARMLAPFGCRLLYTKPRQEAPELERALGLTYAPLETVLAESDIVTLHCPHTPETRGMIDAAALAAMKPGAALINTARGELIDEAALAEAVRSGHLRGAAVDVYSEEPAPPSHPLLGVPGIITTPHIAAMAVDNLAPTLTRMFRNFALIADGQAPVADDVVV